MRDNEPNPQSDGAAKTAQTDTGSGGGVGVPGLGGSGAAGRTGALAVATIGGRRFILTVGAGVVTSVLQWFGKLDPAGSTFALVVGFTVGAYITGNTLQKLKAPPDVDAP